MIWRTCQNDDQTNKRNAVQYCHVNQYIDRITINAFLVVRKNDMSIVFCNVKSCGRNKNQKCTKKNIIINKKGECMNIKYGGK